jgi:hypothetical protein
MGSEIGLDTVDKWKIVALIIIIIIIIIIIGMRLSLLVQLPLLPYCTSPR